MLHIHTDKDCQHDLKVCGTCGNVYCQKCSKEWFKEQFNTIPYQPYTIRWDQPYIVTVGDTRTYSDTSGTYHIHGNAD